MLEEIVFDELLGERVEVAFAAIAPKLVCIDSGANIFIVNFLISKLTNYVVNAVNRQIHTAAVGGLLRVEALFDAGAALGIRFAPRQRLV